MDLSHYDSIRALVLGMVLLAIMLLEQRLPNTGLHRPWRTNLGLWLADTVLMRIVCGACGLAVAVWADSSGVGLLHVLAAPDALAIVCSVLALDGVAWLWHGANHRLPWLWRWHRVHHAEQAFQVTTALRFHPGELLLALPVRLLAIVTFGVTPLALLVFEICFGVMNLLVHANVDLPRRWDAVLGKLLVTPAMHRLHHARDETFLNSNFATIFAFIDRLAGTWRAGRPGDPIDTGLPGSGYSDAMSLCDALVAPFHSIQRSQSDIARLQPVDRDHRG